MQNRLGEFRTIQRNENASWFPIALGRFGGARILGWTNDEERRGRSTNQLIGHAAEPESREWAAAVARHDDQARTHRARIFGDGGRDRALENRRIDRKMRCLAN